jgi:hypothetical protein
MSTPESNFFKLFYRLFSVQFMSDFIKDKSNKNAVRKTEIATARYSLNKGGVATVIFKLKSGEEINWFDYYEADAKKIIESL